MSDRLDTAPSDAPAPVPFAMLDGDASAMVCEGDVCYVPAAPVE
ncbi:hypothetical protein [Agromyces cavernae]|nr:hypothetical protein [Agromyces cavernae]